MSRKMIIYNNAVKIKSKNSRTVLFQSGENDKNVIMLQSLTKYTEKGAGCDHELICNEKIKQTTICLSNDGLIDLYHVIGEYLSKHKTK